MTYTAQKIKFAITEFIPQFPADLVIFTKEIHNRKFQYLCSDGRKEISRMSQQKLK